MNLKAIVTAENLSSVVIFFRLRREIMVNHCQGLAVLYHTGTLFSPQFVSWCSDKLQRDDRFS